MILMTTALATCVLAASAVTPTNVVQYTEAQKSDRAARSAAWRETWAKMTPEEREAHSKAQLKKLQERRAATGEVARTKDKDGNIVITYRDGTVVIHKCGK